MFFGIADLQFGRSASKSMRIELLNF